MGNNNGLNPTEQRSVTHDPYDLTFFTTPDGNEATLTIDIRDVHLAEDFLDLHRRISLRIIPHGPSTCCTFTIDVNPGENYSTLEEAAFNRDIVLKGPEIARVALRSLHEFPGRGQHGVVHDGDDLNYGYYRGRVPPPSEDPIPWRRCRFSDESAANFKAWQAYTGQDLPNLNAVCNALKAELADGYDPSLLSEGLIVEFSEMHRDDSDPETTLGNMTHQLPLQMRV